MIVCDICKDDVATHALGTNKLVYALMPVEIGSHTVEQAEWVNGAATLLTQFLHDKCFSKVMEIARRNVPQCR